MAAFPFLSVLQDCNSSGSLATFAAIGRASSLVGPAWRFSPFPFAGLPVVAGDTALNHFVPPLITRHDEGREVAAAEAKRAERNHNENLQE
jgi:hypothetical protein